MLKVDDGFEDVVESCRPQVRATEPEITVGGRFGGESVLVDGASERG